MRPATVKLLGMELPLPAWAITPMAIIAVIAVPVFIFASVYHMLSDTNASEALRRTRENLLQANAELKNAQDTLRSARDDYEGVR